MCCGPQNQIFAGPDPMAPIPPNKIDFHSSVIGITFVRKNSDSDSLVQIYNHFENCHQLSKNMWSDFFVRGKCIVAHHANLGNYGLLPSL